MGTSIFIGSNNAIVGTKKSKVDDGYFHFEDPEVERICVEKWGDGKGITLEQIKNIKDFNGAFQNSNIEKFNEFQYFENITLYEQNYGEFTDCKKLKSIILPEHLNYLPRYSMARIPNLEYCKSNAPVLGINENAFYQTGKECIIQFGIVNLLDRWTFHYSGVKEVYFNGLMSGFKNLTFSGCNSLTTIVVNKNYPYNDCSLASSIFAAITTNVLKTVDIDYTKIEYMYSQIPITVDTLNLSNLLEVNNYFLGRRAIVRKLIIPKLNYIDRVNIEGIKPYFLGDYSSLEELILPDSFEILYANFAKDYTNLKIVKFPVDLKEVREYAFYNTSLNKIELFDKIESIGENAFTTDNTQALHTVIIRKSIPPTITNTSFSIDTTVCNIYVPDEAIEDYKIAENWSTYATIIKPLSEYVE